MVMMVASIRRPDGHPQPHDLHQDHVHSIPLNSFIFRKLQRVILPKQAVLPITTINQLHFTEWSFTALHPRALIFFTFVPLSPFCSSLPLLSFELPKLRSILSPTALPAFSKLQIFSLGPNKDPVTPNITTLNYQSRWRLPCLTSTLIPCRP